MSRATPRRKTTRPRLSVADVHHAITLQFTTSQQWQLFDRLVGCVEGWRIAETRIAPRPNEARDREWVRLNDNGLSYADIARARNVPRSTVASAC